MKYLGYIQFIVLVLFIWLGWQIIDRITFREEMITPLGAALQSAKNNRKELEKVLRHYQKNPADSLKYKAACFLIENMPFYSYSTSKQLENYKSYYAWLKKSRGQTAKQVADSVKKVYGQEVIGRINLNTYNKVMVATASGYTSGQALKALAELA